MNLIMSLYVALLFVVLTPGVLLRLPPKGPLLTAAIVHGLVFALVFCFTYKMVYRLSLDGFEDMQTCPDGTMIPKGMQCPPPPSPPKM